MCFSLSISIIPLDGCQCVYGCSLHVSFKLYRNSASRHHNISIFRHNSVLQLVLGLLLVPGLLQRLFRDGWVFSLICMFHTQEHLHYILGGGGQGKRKEITLAHCYSRSTSVFLSNICVLLVSINSVMAPFSDSVEEINGTDRSKSSIWTQLNIWGGEAGDSPSSLEIFS